MQFSTFYIEVICNLISGLTYIRDRSNKFVLTKTEVILMKISGLIKIMEYDIFEKFQTRNDITQSKITWNIYQNIVDISANII